MELEGRFTSPENLAQVMRKLSSEFMTGVLTLRCSASSITLNYKSGKFSGSNNPDRPQRLGRILLNRGLIDRAALSEALAYQADFSPSTPLGRVLVHRGRLTIEKLREAAHLQLEEELSELLACSDGFYQFESRDDISDQPPLLEEDPIQMVEEILGRRDEWARIRERIPRDSLIASVMKIAGSSDRELLHLSSREWHVLSLVNGTYDVSCIAARSGLGRFETFRVLASLLANGLIAMHEAKDPSMAHMADQGSMHGSNGSSSSTSSTSSSRWGNLLSRLRDEADASLPAESGRLKFDSPVPFLVEICNQIMAQLLSNQDFIVDPSDEQLTERYWHQILMSYPKADLVTAELNRLDAKNFDRYTRTLGVEGPMNSIYLETVEAISRYLRTLYLLSAQRLGSRTARTLFVNIMDDVRRRSTIGNSDSFFFKEEAAKILE